jgi:hypothetical protein
MVDDAASGLMMQSEMASSDVNMIWGGWRIRTEFGVGGIEHLSVLIMSMNGRANQHPAILSTVRRVRSGSDFL